MKVRIGYGFGVRSPLNDSTFLTVIDTMENLGFDSLWVSDRVGGESPDPVVALSVVAARTRTMKFGTSVMVLPGRNPVLLAKQLATLDRMSNGRLLPAFGLGAVDDNEQRAFAVAREDRASIFNESLEIMRKCWTEESITFHGKHFHLDNVSVSPKPHQHHLDVWLGGLAPSELKRVARVGDGWLPSFVTPDDCARGREVIETHAAEFGRTMDPEHFGVLIPFAISGLDDSFLAALAKRRPDITDVSTLVPQSWEQLTVLIQRFVSVGTSKFVLMPIAGVLNADDWTAHLEEAAPILQPLQT